MSTAQILELILFIVAAVIFFVEAYLRKDLVATGLGVLTVALALVTLNLIK